MIASLRGVLQHKDAEGVVIDCGGVGYGVAMSLSALAQLGAEGSELSLLVHTHVTQESLRLFGFLDASEKRVFSVLLATSGVGPKLALAVLSTFSSAELIDVVGRSDIGALVRIPGVGKKKAERLVLELRERLPKADSAAPAAHAPATPRGELLSALENFGFSPQVAEKAAQTALDEHPDETDLATLVRAALRATTKN